MADATNSRQPKGPLILSILMITVGVGWFLTAQGFGSGINWVWTLGLGMIGIVAFIVSGGLDKVSVILGPFFLVGSIFSVLRQTGRMPIDSEVPMLVILIGVLLLIAQSKFVPLPRWFAAMPSDKT